MTDFRRGFLFAAVTAIIVVAAALVYFTSDRETEEMARRNAEETNLAEQQRVFAEWFALYQRDIDDLSRNWQSYHHIIDIFKTEDIDLATCYERLNRLADDEQELLHRIESRNLPPELTDEFLYGQSLALRNKICAYGAAQYRTIALSRAAADPNAERPRQMPERTRSEDVQDIMIRESPAGLFIADEVYAVREYLAKE